MPATAYENFDLLIESAMNGYRSRVSSSLAGQERVDFVLPFTSAELSDFFQRTGRVYRNFRLAASTGSTKTKPLSPQQFGERLFTAVFAGGVGTSLLRSLDESQRRKLGLRVRVWLDKEVPELADLPWEYLYIPTLHFFPALAMHTSITRYIELAQSEPELQIAPPLRILAVVSSPSDVRPLDVEREWARLINAVDKLKDRNLIVLERLKHATLKTLHERILKDDVHILHFIGHGFFNAKTHVGGLVFEDEEGYRHEVDADRLRILLHGCNVLRLVFLNACEGARSGRTDFFAGTAQKLVQQGVPAVIAMQFEVTDKAAIALAQEFYTATVNGYSVDGALTKARMAVFLAGNELEWGTPVLFSRSLNNRILSSLKATITQAPLELARLEETILIPALPLAKQFLIGGMHRLWPLPSIHTAELGDANYDFALPASDTLDAEKQAGQTEADVPASSITADGICDLLAQNNHQIVVGTKGVGKTWLRLYLERFLWQNQSFVLPVFYFLPRTALYRFDAVKAVHSLARCIAHQLFAYLIEIALPIDEPKDNTRIIRQNLVPFWRQYGYAVPVGNDCLTQPIPAKDQLDIDLAYARSDIFNEIKQAITQTPRSAAEDQPTSVDQMLDDIQSALRIATFTEAFVLIDNLDDVPTQARAPLLSKLLAPELTKSLKEHNIYLKVFVPPPLEGLSPKPDITLVRRGSRYLREVQAARTSVHKLFLSTWP